MLLVGWDTCGQRPMLVFQLVKNCHDNFTIGYGKKKKKAMPPANKRLINVVHILLVIVFFTNNL